MLGPNYWLEANGPYGTLARSSAQKIAWYQFNDWTRRTPDVYQVTGASCTDNSWFDVCGTYLTTDVTPAFRSYPGLHARLVGTADYLTNFLLMGSTAGTHDPQRVSASLPRIGTGMIGRAGTWASRVLVFDYDGFPNNDNPNTDLYAYPAPVWLQGAEFARDYRTDLYKINNTVWSEANFELYSFANNDGRNDPVNYALPISTGIMWGNRYHSNLTSGDYVNPRIGTSGSAGKCYITTTYPGQGGYWVNTDYRTCLKHITGDLTEPKFMTFIITVEEAQTKFYIVGWDEDLRHQRPTSEDNDFYDNFDSFYMETISNYQQYVPPRWMRMLIDGGVRADSGIVNNVLSENKDMIIDWVFYAKDYVFGKSGNLSVWDIPATVKNIRQSLWEKYNDDYVEIPAEQIWRVNTTGFPVSRADNPQTSDDENMAYVNPTDLQFRLDEYWYDPSFVHVVVEPIIDATRPLRHANYQIEWRISDQPKPGVWSQIASAADQGFSYAVSKSLPIRSADGSVKVDATILIPDPTGEGGSPHVYTTERIIYPGLNKHAPAEPQQSDLPKSFVLEQAFPNPFNPSTHIGFAIPVDSYVTLIVYDMTGKEVARLVDGSLAAGHHSATFVASNISSGIYTYRLTAGSFSEIRNFVLMK